jgi:hypothetical protein
MNNGNCLTCYSGYALADGKCVVAAPIIIPNCNTVSDQGVCIDCLEGYFPSGTTCQQVPI